jgi:gliding motility-associated-like protein
LTYHADAEVFTVTSNADAGVGTLREMLDKATANGVVDADVINFSLSPQSEDGRTITILSALPAVSSNLTIDGSSQPGAHFGLSTAKVKILMGFIVDGATALLLYDVQNVSIYGLYIRNAQVCPMDVLCVSWQGIAVRDSRNIEIGAAGKGNVVLGFYENIGMNMHYEAGQLRHYSVDVSVKANFIGVEPDGFTLSTVWSNPMSLYYVIGTLKIGGDPAEGNVLPNGLSIMQANSENYTEANMEMYVTPCIVTIRNNKIGVDYNESQAYTSFGINIGTHSPNGKNTIFIEDNVISSSTSFGVHISNNLYETNIRRNYIGTDHSLSKVFPVASVGIFVYGATNVKIGSSDPADKNYITNCKPINVWPYSQVSVNKNSFFCVQDMYPMVFDTYGTFFYPKINITSVTGTSVLGTATPNSEIELFYADHCGTCAPETYFGSTTTDSQGDWRYDGIVQTTVIASATLNGSTSNFTKTGFDFTSAIVENTCPDYGSIRGVVPLNFTSMAWVNEAGTVVGTTADLLNVPVGKYKLRIENGSCSNESPWYEIKKGLVLNSSGINVTNASCNVATGSITGLNLTNYTTTAVRYSWEDAKGNIVGTTLNLNNAKPGTYILSVKLEDNSCTLPYGPVEIKNVSGAVLNETNLVIKPSDCGKSDGGISGITATGIGQLRYQWKNETGSFVASTSNLTNTPSGKYILEVLDESPCGAVYSTVITVPEINGISLSDTGVIQHVTCGQSNGSISGILVSGATKYQWFDQSAHLVSTTAIPGLSNAKVGSYYLVASNASCSKTSKIYTIIGNAALVPPNVNDIQLCAGGDAILIVNNVSAGRLYKLYADEYSATPLQEEKSGRFNINVKETRRYYVTEYENGCESLRSKVEVSVSSSVLFIPASFSPNGDGVNDTWVIRGIESYARAEVLIVNRYGLKVYKSTNYQVPFEGKLNGSLLPPGIYYYVIKLGNECGPVSGSITLLR